MTDVTFQRGFPDDQRPVAARLFWEAFGKKLKLPLGPDHRALAFVEAVMKPDHAFAAMTKQGELLGLAGFKDADGLFVDGEITDLAAVYGRFGAVWRGLLLSLFERKPDPGTLVMDGIFVTEAARGQGLGGKLLQKIFEHARARNFSRVRLDVIDTNPRARALYERQGFQATGTETLGPILSRVFGFRASTTMIRELINDDT